MSAMSEKIQEQLFALRDEGYRDFQARLVPTVDPDSIIGVRTPDMRKVAKEVFESSGRDEFLSDLPHRYYEENLVHFFTISLIRDFDRCVRAVEAFLPYVDCWPVSAQATPKAFKKHHRELLPHIMEWISSEHTYTARFGIRMLMNEFLDDDFKEEYPELVASKQGDDYYLRMMIAWYFATALAKQYDRTLPFMEGKRLGRWTHNKAIRKALESWRISEEHKAYLRTLKISGNPVK